MDPTSPFADAPVIHAYTRAEATADGALIDVTAQACQVGFVWPVAVTHALWADINAIPDRLLHLVSVEGRLHDVLWMAFCAIKLAPAGGDESTLLYRLHLPRPHASRGLYLVKLACGPGDEAEPVITLMKPDES